VGVYRKWWKSSSYVDVQDLQMTCDDSRTGRVSSNNVRISGEAESLHIVQGLEDGILESLGRRSMARDLRLDAEFEHIRSGEVCAFGFSYVTESSRRHHSQLIP
jgi:hypothetical protein